MTSATWSLADSNSAVRVARMRDPLYIDADLEEQEGRARNRSDQCKPAEPPS
jgi:hypothetical protein